METSIKKKTVRIRLPPLQLSPEQEFRKWAHPMLRMGIPASKIQIRRLSESESEARFARLNKT